MIIYRINRPKDSVVVAIMPHKDDKKYSFINLTKNHICPCKFSSVDEAIADMERLKREGKIISYKKTHNDIYDIEGKVTAKEAREVNKLINYKKQIKNDSNKSDKS